MIEALDPTRGPETDLLTALRSGDERAFRRLVTEHGPRMLAVARRLLGSEEDARDALQEAFVQAFRALHRFEGNALISTWLHRIVVNAALMRIRRRKKWQEETLDDLLPAYLDDGHPVHPFVDWPESADRLLERAETRGRVRSAIDRLPESARTILLLRDIEELSTAEVAELLATTPNAVKIRLHRARQALRELLDRDLRTKAA